MLLKGFHENIKTGSIKDSQNKNFWIQTKPQNLKNNSKQRLLIRHCLDHYQNTIEQYICEKVLKKYQTLTEVKF